MHFIQQSLRTPASLQESNLIALTPVLDLARGALEGSTACCC
eukprot:SAG31_NODE_34674_length_330_cov_1.290043_1_plen_41_part_10